MNRRYFSLVELLTVITVIAILAGIAIPVIMHMASKGKETKARAEMNAIKLGLTQFKSDYGIFPVTAAGDTLYSAGYSSVDHDADIDAMLQHLTLIQTKPKPVTGDPPDPYTSTINTKKTRYLDVPAKPVPDLVKLHESDYLKGYYILDPWGRRYNIALDTDYNGQLALTAAFTKGSAETIAEKIAIFSFGNAEDTSDREAFLYTWKTSAE
ncbi:MAG: Type II secretion system protein G precursor [Lentisphaerae bacterium ADurb.Bin242]|nr:MAG: Type II secretion system protein G precursor [Lentisphaerae bacterium ADurb.Bin242]